MLDASARRLVRILCLLVEVRNRQRRLGLRHNTPRRLRTIVICYRWALLACVARVRELRLRLLLRLRALNLGLRSICILWCRDLSQRLWCVLLLRRRALYLESVRLCQRHTLHSRSQGVSRRRCSTCARSYHVVVIRIGRLVWLTVLSSTQLLINATTTLIW
jgi:hypothetical protein